MALILVLDDDPVIADLIRMVLAEEGLDVTTAGSLAQVDEHVAPDLVVADLVLAGSYTRERARETVRLLNERFPSRPLVLVTAHAQATRDGLGASEVVTKPFDVDSLVAAVRRALPN
ncbi:MAG TPA: response regulator [Candidatus Limnocylindria bacterium]|nr:response regulator [Candidatus Limnocylindria bacterium]